MPFGICIGIQGEPRVSVTRRSIQRGSSEMFSYEVVASDRDEWSVGHERRDRVVAPLNRSEFLRLAYQRSSARVSSCPQRRTEISDSEAGRCSGGMLVGMTGCWRGLMLGVVGNQLTLDLISVSVETP